MSTTTHKEGSLEAPTRHPINWKDPDFYNEELLFNELERVFDICHGCRRCVSLCHAFPTLFDLVDESDTMEVDGVAREDYWKVVDHCYLCDLCYMTKCPYVPPHEWNVDFPHLMLQAKAQKHKNGKSKLRDRILTSTDAVGHIAGIPVIAQVVNAVNKIGLARKVMAKTVGVHSDAVLPEFHSNSLRKRVAKKISPTISVEQTESTRGQVVLFTTCYGNRNAPDMVEDLITVFEHNGIPVRITEKEKCCGMPKMELGDLESVEQAKSFNIPILAAMVDEGWDLIAPVPSCVLMFFKKSLGKIAYHVPCHQRVQNIGLKTRDILQLIPDTNLDVIERCSGHDGTYAVKSEFHDISMKICRTVVNRVSQGEVDHYISDCPMAGHQIENGLQNGSKPESAFTLLRMAYGI
jgi:Fe-S oxidoreductase